MVQQAMRPHLVVLVLLFCACSPRQDRSSSSFGGGTLGESTEDSTGPDGGAVDCSQVGHSGTTSDLGDSTGTVPEEEWPPLCLESTPTIEATCAAFEAVTDDDSVCEREDGLRAAYVEMAVEDEAPNPNGFPWVLEDDESPWVVLSDSCGVPLRWVYDGVENTAIYPRYRVRWEYETVAWLCESVSSLTILRPGQIETVDISEGTSPVFRPPGASSEGWCCLVTGNPTDQYVRTPCQ